MELAKHIAPNATEILQNRLSDSYVSLAGAGIGGGLFLIVVVLGVIFWISKEREEDEEVRVEAERFIRGRTRGAVLELKEIPFD